MSESKNNAESRIVRRGSFRIGYKNEKRLIIICLAGAAASIMFMVLGLVMFGAPENVLGFMTSFFWLIPAALCLAVIPALSYGRNCTYYADESEFRTVTPAGTDYLYYSDISEVVYKPIMKLGRKRGYLVTVVTGVRDFTYPCLFGRNSELTEPEHTPFYLLELNAGLKQPQPRDEEHSTAVMAMFAEMQERQADRLSRKAKKSLWKD